MNAVTWAALGADHWRDASHVWRTLQCALCWQHMTCRRIEFRSTLPYTTLGVSCVQLSARAPLPHSLSLQGPYTCKPAYNIHGRARCLLTASLARNVNSFAAAPARTVTMTASARIAAAKAALDLREQGWTSIEGILSPEECAQYVDSVWNWLESLGTGIDRNDPKSWSDERWPPTFKGIINVLEVAHQAFVWKVRSHPKVTEVFRHLWGTTELLSSFDSINVLRPGSHVVSTDDWLHCDQAPHRKGLVCIQGLVNMVDVGPDTGTLLVKDASHAGHEQFFATESMLTEEEKLTTADFYQFQPEERKFYEQYKAIPLSAKAGSLFLWDSRTAHQNIMPAKTDKWRHVVYCCYQPRDMATKEDLKLKRQAWDEYRNVAIFPKLGPGYYDIDKDDIAAQEAYMQKLDMFQVHHNRNNLPEVVSKLAGVTPYSAEEVQTDSPLVHMSCEELYSIVEQGA